MSFAAAVIGLLSGVLSGAFGIGGGIVTTPAIIALGYAQLVAVGTPLPVIVPTALTGAYAYARRGLVDVRAGLVVGAFGAATSVGGAFAAEALGGLPVLLVTSALIAYTAVDLVVAEVHSSRAAQDEAPADPPSRPSFASLAVLGLATGLYSGLLGLGGGFIVVPALSRWLGLPIKRAIGTSLLAVSIVAVPGTVTHWALGNVDLVLAASLAVGVVPGALLGARLTGAAKDRTVRLGFAAMLAATGVWLVFAALAGA